MADRTRRRFTTVRLNDAERDVLESAAAAAGVSLSEVVRSGALAAARSILARDPDEEADAAALQKAATLSAEGDEK